MNHRRFIKKIKKPDLWQRIALANLALPLVWFFLFKEASLKEYLEGVLFFIIYGGHTE